MSPVRSERIDSSGQQNLTQDNTKPKATAFPVRELRQMTLQEVYRLDLVGERLSQEGPIRKAPTQDNSMPRRAPATSQDDTVDLLLSPTRSEESMSPGAV